MTLKQQVPCLLLMQMRDELVAAIQDLKALLAQGNADFLEADASLDNLPENAADEHAGLGFR